MSPLLRSVAGVDRRRRCRPGSPRPPAAVSGRPGAPGLAPPGRVVEFGPGWGNVTADLAATVFAVAAVEVGAGFADLVRAWRPAGVDLPIEVADMLVSEPSEQIDAAVFFEIFHHWADQ